MKKILMLIAVGSVLTGCGSDGGSANIGNNGYINNNTTSAVLASEIEKAQAEFEENSNNIDNMPIFDEDISNNNINSNDNQNYPTNPDITPVGQLTGKDFSEFDNVVVDIDISALSSTMATAQLNNMIYPYESYLGQTVKMNGEYYAQSATPNGVTYHFLLMMDETNCCQGVMEFMLPEGVDYPPMGSEIMIVGEYVLDITDMGEYPYLSVTDYIF